jgi:hypothetical protein
MPRTKRNLEQAVTIEGIALIWKLHREQQRCTDGWKGMAIHVCVAAEGARRELHLEYPAVKTQKVGYFRTDRVVVNIRPGKVEEHIKEAMAAGWDPASRGKPFIFEVSELPS